jgi:hypothetical protein
MNQRDREFADAARMIDESQIMRTIRHAFIFVERPFQGRGFPSVTATLKGSLYVLCIGIACVTHALLLQLMPDRLAPVKPLAYGMVLAFAALATAAGLITTRSNATATADSSAGTANARKS